MRSGKEKSGYFHAEGGPAKKSAAGRVFRFVGLLLILVILPLGFLGWQKFYVNIIEKELPIVKLGKLPSGIGVEPVTLTFWVRDDQSGVDEVVVRAGQGRELKTLLSKTYPKKVERDKITLEIDGKSLGIVEGEVEITVAVFDRSFWSNSKRVSFDLRVDYELPEIEVLTTQHNAVRGGTQLVFYRLPEEEDAFSGVTVGSELFPGFPAVRLDKDFSSRPDVYFAFFAIPLDFDPKSEAVSLFVRDQVGNSSTLDFRYRLREISKRELKLELSDDFLNETVRRSYRRYLAQKKGEASQSDEGEGRKDGLSRFQVINEKLRIEEEHNLRVLFARPRALRLWQGTFARIALNRLPWQFGDTINYEYKGQAVGSRQVFGFEYAGRSDYAVPALNNGVVIYADNLMLLGNTIILDHGFGLNTLYAHLSSLDRKEGDEVLKGDTIGKLGSTGLVERTKLYLEVRLHGVPVRAIEWWDRNWIRDHIIDRISSVKKQLGIRAKEPLK